MKYILLIIVVAVVSTGIYLVANANTTQEAPIAIKNQGSVATNDTAYSIDVEIDKVVRDNQVTEVYLTLNNHAVDLTTLDPLPFTTLNGKSPTSYEIENEAMGGHHVQSKLVFEGQLSGNLIFGVSESQNYKLTVN